MARTLRPFLTWTSLPIVVAMLALMTVSLLSVRAAESADPKDLAGFTTRQAIYVAVALVGFAVASAFPFRQVGRWAYVWYGLNLALLVLVLYLPAIRYSHRWIRVWKFQFQPSELAKLTYILALAWYLRYRANYRRLLGLIPPFVLTCVPAALILIEPDLGTTLLLFPTLFFMLFMAGARLRHLLAVLGVAAFLVLCPVPYNLDAGSPDEAESRAGLAYWTTTISGRRYAFVAAPLARLPVVNKTLMKTHQVSRIQGWLRQSDPAVAMDQGFQLQQSMMILGSGGLAGCRIPEAKDLYFRWLPDDHTDFIFAVIGGQWGLKGCGGVMLIYLAIFICGAEIAAVTQDPFGRLVVVGVLGLLFSQIFINVGMTLGLMPITGMTLPLISFGGSSMLVNALALGLLVNVSRCRPRMLARKPFDHDAKTPEQQATYKRPMPAPDGT